MRHVSARLFTIAFGFVSLAVLSAPALATDDDVKAVEGTWIPIQAELGGAAWPEAVLKTIVLKLSEGKYEVVAAGKLDKGTCSYDMAASPKRLTIKGTE